MYSSVAGGEISSLLTSVGQSRISKSSHFNESIYFVFHESIYLQYLLLWSGIKYVVIDKISPRL